MMLSLDTAYRSFGGEVEALSTPTICRPPDSRRHQLSAIALALEPSIQKVVVYTFGSPRTGGTKFFNEYTPLLGSSTFRLIDGTDIVPTVPPSLSGGYRHVGRAIQCETDEIFDAQTPIMSPNDNKPDLFESVLQSGIADLG